MKKVIALVLAAVVGVTLLSSQVFAGGEKSDAKDKAKHVYGKVEVVKDGDTITEIKIVGEKETVSVVLDEKGKELAAMEGKEVKVKGQKGDDDKITVSEFKEKPVKTEKKEKKDKEKTE